MGGGGSAGAVSYPTYMQDTHYGFLSNAGVDGMAFSVTDAFNAAYGNSPFAGRLTYDPANDLVTSEVSVTECRRLAEELDFDANYRTAVNLAMEQVDGYIADRYLSDPIPSITTDATTVNDEVDSYRAQQLDDLELRTLPRYRAGMLNINAVQSSSFVIGEAIIRGLFDRDVNKYSSELRYKLFLQDGEINGKFLGQREEIKSRHFTMRNEMVRSSAAEILMSLYKKRDYWNEATRLTIESNRIKIVAKKEQVGEQLDIDENDAKWNLELFQYPSNVLASIGGGLPTQKRANKAVSALAGGLSGAASGASIGAQIGGASSGPYAIYGAAIGAVAGAALGYFGTQ